MSYTVLDGITPELNRIIAGFSRPRSILGAGAKAVQKGILAHLARLQARGNAKGWPQQFFFSGRLTSVAKNVGVTELTDVSATVTVADPRFVHHISGGEIRAKRGRALSIPLTPQAARLAGKGSLRQSAPWLVMIKSKSGQAFLAAPTTKNGPLVNWFILKSRVTTSPHPEAAPDEAELAREAKSAMRKAADLLVRV